MNEQEVKWAMGAQTRYRRLLSAMQLGILIHAADGHRWIVTTAYTAHDQPDLNQQLLDAGFETIRTKCYGAIDAALDTIDEALKKLGKPDLLTYFNEEMWK